MKLVTTQEESQRVYDEGPILLKDLDHAASRKLGRKPQSHPAFVGGARLREVEGAPGDGQQSLDPMGLERSSLSSIEEGLRESTEQDVVPRPTLGICVDGSFENLPGFVALSDHGRS